MEHYCTLFDLNYLPLGMALHNSLLRTGGDFQLWILCMDDGVEAALRKLDLPRIRLLPLRDLEAMFPALMDVRTTRSHGEYCWTSTPFLPEAVLRIAPEISRVTYVDADIFFFGSPTQILSEFEQSKAHVLLTEHDYTPDQDNTETTGRFCVQLMPFSNSDKALEILRWWQGKCLQCCTSEVGGETFGDQKYLDEWPSRFGDSIHILRNVELTLGPWNVRHLWKGGSPKGSYHFSGLRIFAGGETMMSPAEHTVAIPLCGMRNIYLPYAKALREAWRTCQKHGIVFHLPPAPRNSFLVLRRLRRLLLRIQCWTRIDRSPWLSICGWTPFTN
jgi:hypothetical protein